MEGRASRPAAATLSTHWTFGSRTGIAGDGLDLSVPDPPLV